MLFLGYVALHADEIALIMRKTTRGLLASYGRMMAGSRYYVDQVAPVLSPEAGRAWLAGVMQLSLMVCAAGFAVAALAGWRLRRRFAVATAPSAPEALFVIGALIYGGTFLLGSNWSYRLSFLLLCLPLLLRGCREPELRGWGAGCLVAAIANCAAPLRLPLTAYLAQQALAWLLAWALFGGAVALVARRWERGAGVPEGGREPRLAGDGPTGRAPAVKGV